MEDRAVNESTAIEQTASEIVSAAVLLEDAVKLLAQIRNNLETSKTQLSIAQLRLEQSIEYQMVSDYKSHLDQLKSQERQTMDKIRRLAVEVFRETQNKKPHPGIGIQVKKELVYEEKTAIEWARLYLPDAVMLDADLFEKHAKAVAETQPIPFVQIVEVYTATIATRLPEQD